MITINISKAKKCFNTQHSLFISFPYDTYLVNAIRNLPERYWDANKLQWEVPLNQLNTLLPQFNRETINIIDEGDVLFGKKETARKQAINYEFKTKPFDHQIEGFNYGMNNDKWLLGDEQGLGKTKQVIDIACAKKQERNYKHCLIICGVNGLKWNWQGEIETHSSEQGWILGQRWKGKNRDSEGKETKGKWMIGSNVDKLNDAQTLDRLPYFIITNVESLRDSKICDALVKACKKGEINMIAADEVHKMKNPQSQQGKAFLKLQAETMIAMTGTPLMNTPLDLFIILKWLGYETHTFYAFKNHYCEMGGFGGYQIVGYRNLNELQERLNKIMLRRLKDDVLDLPEKTIVDEYVEMTSAQSKIYKEVTSELKANIDKLKMSNNPLAEMIRLRQATGYTGILSSDIQESAKLDRLEELVDDAIQNGKKVIIFSNWTQITDEVLVRLNEKGINTLQITGETKDEERQLNVKKFQEDKKYKVIVGTTGAMGTGLTLTEASIEIFMDEPWNKALYDQATDRAHRIGQKNNVTIYNLLAKGTIDEKIHQLVYKKGKMSDLLVDNIVEDKGALVEYLLS